MLGIIYAVKQWFFRKPSIRCKYKENCFFVGENKRKDDIISDLDEVIASQRECIVILEKIIELWEQKEVIMKEWIAELERYIDGDYEDNDSDDGGMPSDSEE